METVESQNPNYSERLIHEVRVPRVLQRISVQLSGAKLLWNEHCHALWLLHCTQINSYICLCSRLVTVLAWTRTGVWILVQPSIESRYVI